MITRLSEAQKPLVNDTHRPFGAARTQLAGATGMLVLYIRLCSGTQMEIPAYNCLGNMSASELEGQPATADPVAAFLSYCNPDSDFADWLQSGLRTTKSRNRFSGDSTQSAPSDGGSGKLFAIRTDFAAGLVHRKIRAALEPAEHLIVVCSPNAAGSDYVNGEIRVFKQLGKGDAMLLAIVAGEPHAGRKPVIRKTRNVSLKQSFTRSTRVENRPRFLNQRAARCRLPGRKRRPRERVPQIGGGYARRGSR